jgi:ornithine--oxo-acid transaminase
MPNNEYATFVNPAWIETLSALGMDSPIVRAEGSYLFNAEGERFLDLVAGFGAVVLGHNYPALIDRIMEEFGKNAAYLNPWGYSSAAGPLAGILLRLANAPLTKVHFSNTGAEAVESAIKFAMIATGRERVLVVHNGFHGLTLWATQAAGHPTWRNGLTGTVDYAIDYIDINDVSGAQTYLNRKNYAAVLLEPLQGSSNGLTWDSSSLQRLIEAANTCGTLVAFDEVMTGLGRTGTWFAFQQILPEGVAPDLLIVSKALSGGMIPVSAVLMTEVVYSRMFESPGRAKSHGSTYSGNHLGLFTALTTLELLQDRDLLQNSIASGEYLRQEFESLKERYPILLDVNGRGLVWALTFGYQSVPSSEIAAEVCMSLLERGVLTSIAAHIPSCLRITPPLTISQDELSLFLEALTDSLESIVI